MAPLPYMDHVQATLNPCSVETIPEPITLADSSKVWPLVVSCYELDEASGRRNGKADMFTVPVPDISEDKETTLPLKFGSPHTFTDKISGILDGKWSEFCSPGDDSKSWCFATAQSSGEIRSFRLQIPRSLEGYPPVSKSDPLYTIAEAGASEPPEDNDGAPLCLSLNWEPSSQWNSKSGMKRIVSTYSNGTVAIHDVSFSSGSTHFIARESWRAHSIFTSPAEVWSASFACDGDQNMILSCGDEGSVKVWDIRSNVRPMHELNFFESGATCASHHPRHEHLVACGSYDERVCIYDIRYLSQKPLFRSDSLGGGIWRLKWHPYSDQKLLVSAMHGGCLVLRVSQDVGVESGIVDAPSFEVTKTFTEHESMAYGADWLVSGNPAQKTYFEAAASCSFYDRSIFLWETV